MLDGEEGLVIAVVEVLFDLIVSAFFRDLIGTGRLSRISMSKFYSLSIWVQGC